MKRWYGNLKIGWKLGIGFGVIVALVSTLAVYSMLTANNIDAEYSYLMNYPQDRLDKLSDAETAYVTARRALSNIGMYAGMDGAEASINAQLKAIDEIVPELNGHFAAYRESVATDPKLSNADKDTRILALDELPILLSQWRNDVAEPVYRAALNGDREEILRIASSQSAISDNLTNGLGELHGRARTLVDEIDSGTSVMAQNSIWILTILSIVTILLCILLAVIITVLITAPMKRLVALVSDVAGGNININMDRANVTKDETGELTLDVYDLVDVIKTIISDISALTHRIMDNGDTDFRIELSKYKGSYLELTDGINHFADNYLNEVTDLVEIISQIGAGNFNAELQKLPGKKADINRKVEALQANLRSLSAEMSNLVENAMKGKLDVRADAKKYQGDWAAILNILNKLMEVIAAPIHEAADVLQAVSVGNFDNKMQGSYQGDFLLIKDSINSTVTNVAGYITEISEVLGALANDDLDQHITREYVGKFSEIKEALLNIIEKFNNVISDIFSAADQVSAGSKQIAESSMTLAQGATEQASSVEELNATIVTINESTKQNAGSAKEAEALSDNSRKSAARGGEDMNHMLASMESIKESSNSISKIIKVIEDIAFQTNLLALNAAVEAARAGEHGKGFAVVAEEVRNLANRSQNAAKETAGLIDESISRVNDGTKIAAQTSEALQAIISDVTKVADIITGIASASQEQASAISQVSEGLAQITEVVQDNSATSEESASASQELSSQAEVLKNLVNVFKLKRRR